MNFRYPYLLYVNYTRNFSSTLHATAVNHYTALGVTQKATQSEVKSAYYRLSKVYHPDKNQGSMEAANKFKDITTAYEVLGNVRLRKLYDKGIDVGAGRTTSTVYRHQAEDDDPTMRFYRSREYRTRPPSATGRTPIYDFDEWSRAHYGATFAKDMARKRRIQWMKERQDIEISNVKMESVLLLFLCLFALLMAVMDDSTHDKVTYVQTDGKNTDNNMGSDSRNKSQ